MHSSYLPHFCSVTSPFAHCTPKSPLNKAKPSLESSLLPWNSDKSEGRKTHQFDQYKEVVMAVNGALSFRLSLRVLWLENAFSNGNRTHDDFP